MDIKQEDLIKFWTWCGFKVRKPHNKNSAMLYSDPRTPDCKSLLILPEITIETLYQYAVPFLQSNGYIVQLIANAKHGFKVEIYNWRYNYKMEHLSPTEALYQAILKVIDNEVK